jgi:hypothetical protein
MRAQKEEEYEATSKLVGIYVFGGSGQAAYTSRRIGETRNREMRRHVIASRRM